MNPPRESVRSAEISAAECSHAVDESPRLATVRDEPKPAETARGSEPTDAEMERAIVDAVTGGAIDVARVLAAQLEERRHARTPANVVHLARDRRR